MTLENKILKTNYFKIGMIVSMTAVLSFLIWDQSESFAASIFSDDFVYASQSAADTAWPTSNTSRLRVNQANEELDWNIISSSSAESVITHDLGTALPDDGWILRYKLDLQAFSNPSSTGIAFETGLSDNTSLRTGNQDFIGMESTIDADTNDQFFRGVHSDNSYIGVAGAKFSRIPSVETIYVEIVRDSASQFTITQYSNSAYTNVLESKSYTMSGNPTSLQYIKIAVQGNSGTNTVSGIIDDVEVSTPPPLCNGLEATIEGTSGNDVLIGTSGDDVIVGLEGTDYILGNGGDDTICGGDDDDFIRGGEGEDYIEGENGNDLIMGDQGNDTLKGNDGADRILGGSGADTLKGGNGDDMLSGNSEDDTLDGESNNDVCDDSEPSDTLVSCEISN